MAEIKNLNIFGTNKGLDAIKKEIKEQKKPQVGIKKEKTTNLTTQSNEENSNVFDVTSPVNQPMPKKRVGAPVRNHDKVYSATQPIKLSAILNATTRVLTEKYMVEYSKDELLRVALNEYVKQNLTKEDKVDLLNDVIRDLNIFRKKYPVVPKRNEAGNIIQNVQDIEEETTEYLKNEWSV